VRAVAAQLTLMQHEALLEVVDLLVRVRGGAGAGAGTGASAGAGVGPSASLGAGADASGLGLLLVGPREQSAMDRGDISSNCSSSCGWEAEPQQGQQQRQQRHQGPGQGQQGQGQGQQALPDARRPPLNWSPVAAAEAAAPVDRLCGDLAAKMAAFILESGRALP
jgi:hypothetical protein